MVVLGALIGSAMTAIIFSLCIIASDSEEGKDE